MAQLARCPACYSEIELPAEVAEGDLAGARAQCPACDEMFLLADAKPRLVKQAVLVRESNEVAKSEPSASPESNFSEGAARIAATIDNPTLAAFLGLDKTVKPTTAPAGDELDTETEEAAELDSAEPEPKPAIDLGDFQSLDELFKSSAKRTTEPSPPAAEVARYDDGLEDDQPEADEEPSPAADRLRPTLGELFAATKPAASTSLEDTATREDDLDRDLAAYLNEVEPAQHTKSTVDDFTELTMHDMPVPKFDGEDQFDADDFERSSDEGVEVSKSLRAAMGFADDEPLVAEDSDHELVGVGAGSDAQREDELSFAQVEAPRGTVATRRRKSPSMLRTMFGVVMGGVTGIVGGYLALLWIFHFVGRSEDPLDLAKFYPDIVKPVEYQSSADAPLPIENPLAANDDVAPLPDTFGDAGEVDQANFEAEVPAENLADNPVETPAPSAEAPAAWDDPAAPAPLAQPPVKVVIEGAPNYTAAQVQQATAAAQAIAADLVADGPLDQKKGSSYATLAALADAVTFGEGDAKTSWKLPARELYPQLFTTPTTQENIAKIAGYWITSPKREHGGIFFSGTLDEGRQQGSVAEYQVTLPTGQVLAVLTPQPLDIPAGTPMVVVGSLVRDPVTHVEGYTGTADMAVWSEQVLPLAP